MIHIILKLRIVEFQEAGSSPGVSKKMLRKTQVSDTCMYVGNFYDVSKILISTQSVPYLLINAKRYNIIPISILLLKRNINRWVLSISFLKKFQTLQQFLFET